MAAKHAASLTSHDAFFHGLGHLQASVARPIFDCSAPIPAVRRTPSEQWGGLVNGHSPALIILIENNVVARGSQDMIRPRRRSDEVRR